MKSSGDEGDLDDDEELNAGVSPVTKKKKKKKKEKDKNSSKEKRKEASASDDNSVGSAVEPHKTTENSDSETHATTKKKKKKSDKKKKEKKKDTAAVISEDDDGSLNPEEIQPSDDEDDSDSETKSKKKTKKKSSDKDKTKDPKKKKKSTSTTRKHGSSTSRLHISKSKLDGGTVVKADSNGLPTFDEAPGWAAKDGTSGNSSSIKPKKAAVHKSSKDVRRRRASMNAVTEITKKGQLEDVETIMSGDEFSGDDDDSHTKKKKERRGKKKHHRHQQSNNGSSSNLDGTESTKAESVSVKEAPVSRAATKKTPVPPTPAQPDGPCALHKLLDIDPFSKSHSTYNEDAIVDVIFLDPAACSNKYKFECFGGEIYPFSMLCALGASLRVLKMCYDAHPQAGKEKDIWIGTPLHYACAYVSTTIESLTLVVFVMSPPFSNMIKYSFSCTAWVH